MKRIICLCLLLFSAVAAANEAPQFSAFSIGDKLYVTILADSCNNLYGALEVDNYCKEDRVTKNLALVCSVELVYSMTKMACHDKTLVARVMTIDLNESNVAYEAQILKVSHAEQEIEVLLDR